MVYNKYFIKHNKIENKKFAFSKRGLFVNFSFPVLLFDNDT